MLRCTRHQLSDCAHSECRADREHRAATPTLSEAVVAALTDLRHPLHRAVYRRDAR